MQYELVPSYCFLMKLSIGNLPQSFTDEDLKKLFSGFGEITHLSIKRDKKTGTSLGYGSLELPDENGLKAIESLNGKEIEGKKIAVVDSASLLSKDSNKNKDKATSQKINQKATGGGFVGGAVRRSGGGGRGK